MVLNIQVLLISLQWMNLDMLLRFRLVTQKTDVHFNKTIIKGAFSRG